MILLVATCSSMRTAFRARQVYQALIEAQISIMLIKSHGRGGIGHRVIVIVVIVMSAS